MSHDNNDIHIIQFESSDFIGHPDTHVDSISCPKKIERKYQTTFHRKYQTTFHRGAW